MSVLDEIFGSAPAGRSAIPTESDLGAVRRSALPQAGGIGSNDAIERLLAREGGYSDNAADRGGKTNFGISSKAYPNLDVSKLSREQAAEIYKRDYWDAIGADQLDPAVREIAFDAAVNHGVGTARKMLAESGGDPQKMLALRQRLYDNLAAKNPSQKQFSAGWRNRLAGLSPVASANAAEADWQTSMPMPSEQGGMPQDEILDSIFGGELPQRAAPEQGVGIGDFGRALAITGGDFAKAPISALENFAGQLAGDEGDATERRLAESQRGLGGVRRSIGEWQKGFFQSMSPEAIDRAQRELLTLDPSKTIWQGGVQEFMSSLALKGTLSIGPTVGPMITTALLSRVGVGAAASTLYGAQEGLMSAGLSAAQIADDIEQTPIEELRKVERFAALEAQVGEAEARRQYVNEVQGIIPAVTGVLVGAIAKAVGKPLDKIFGTGEGLPLLQRIRAGATTESLQEGPQSFVEQVTQNYAQMAYDADINLLDGAAEQTVQGLLFGGIMGGTFTGAFGNRPRNNPMSSDPVPADLRAAIGGMSGAATTPPPPAGGSGPGPTEAIPTNPFGSGEQAQIAERIAAQYAARGERLSMSDLDLLVQEEMRNPLSLAPEPPPPLGDRFAVSDTQREQGGMPFEPSVIPTPDTMAPNAAPDTIDFPQAAPAATGRRKKVTAPRGAIPLSLEEPQVPDTFGMETEGVPTDVQQAVQSFEPKPEDVVQPDFLPPAPPPPGSGVELAPPVPYDVNQRREPKHGTRPRTEQLGYRVRLRGPNGEILSSELFETNTRARLKAHQMERALRGVNDGRYVEVLPARRTFVNDRTPTPEPISDIMAQVRAMQGGDPQRTGVYLTRETLENLQEAGQVDQVLRGGIPIRNFDTYGGILLARDEETAQELMQLIEDPNSNIDEVIGLATGAGNGKPGGTNPVVQLLDDEGNVIRERQVTPEEVQRTVQDWGPNARVMELERALAIRQNRMQREKAERQVAREQQAFTESRPDQQVQDMFGENPITQPFAEQAGAIARQGGFEEDIGGRLTDLAVETRAQELKRRKLDKRIPAPDDVKFRGREVVERSRQETRLRREGKTEEADKVRSSLGGGAPKRDELSKAYRELYDRATTAALKVEEAKLGGSVQDVTEAETEYDTLIEELRAFYDMEGGYTKAEAIQQASKRYSPKGTKETLRALAQSRAERKAKQEAKEEESMEAVRAAREERYQKNQTRTTRDERIIARIDEPREEKKLRNIAAAEKVSVETMADKLKRIRKQVSTPEGQRLIENLFMLLSPSVGRDLDQVVDQTKLGTKDASEKHRTAVATALLETNQLLRQWLSDYRLALRYNTPAADTDNVRRDAYIASKAQELTEMLGQLKAWHQGDIGIADDAARYLAHRIARMVVIGKRVGIGTELDIDGFWEAAAKGPMAFRDYLANTVQSREDLPFPLDLTNEKLEQVSLGTLNALYVKAIEHLDGSRETDGQRREMVKAIKKAISDRVGNLSDKPEVVEVELWDRKKHGYVTVKREISPRKLMAETFRRSYGVRGADSRMSMEQLKELYLKGGTVTVWENGYVDFGKDEKHPPKLVKKGKAKVVKLPPLAASLPEAQPLNVFARRVPPEKKRRVIMRAARNMDRKRYGGKSQSTGLTRSATSDDPRARAATKYNTGVLLEDTRPRELSAAQEVEYQERKSNAEQSLSDALSNAAAFLSKLDTAAFKKAAGDPQALIHAKAYFRWLTQFGQSLENAKLKSYAAFDEMLRVAVDINDIASLNPEQFVDAIERRFKAEVNEQVFRAVALDPLNMKGVSDPARRQKLLEESLDRVRQSVMFHKRLTEVWANHPIFLQDVQPVLNKISEAIAVRHRGEFQTRGGWAITKFTDEERTRVMAVLEEWRTAKDKPQAERRRIWQAWGVPADTLYDDFWKPLHSMLRDAGFIDPDDALLKQYNRRFTSYEDQSTGPVEVMSAGEDLSGVTVVKRRFATVSEADPVALAAAELEQRKQEIRDRELAALDDDEAIELNAADRERRRKLLASPIGKTAESARKLLRANEIISAFTRTLENTNLSVRNVELAERRMLDQLAEIGLYRPTGKDLGTIGLPDTAPVLAKLEQEQAELQKALKALDADEDTVDSPLVGKKAEEVERLLGELQASRQALEDIRALRLGNQKARSMAYRLVGPRLVAGEITLAQARLAATEKLTGFWVKQTKAERLDQEKAKTKGDTLKERAAAAAAENKRREGMTLEQRRAAESLDRRYGPNEVVHSLSRVLSQNDKALTAFGDAVRKAVGTRKEVPAAEVLRAMEESGVLKGHGALNSLVVSVLRNLNLNTKVVVNDARFVELLATHGDAMDVQFFHMGAIDGSYFAEADTVAIPEKLFGDSQPAGSFAATLLHELVHAGTLQAINKDGELQAYIRLIMGDLQSQMTEREAAQWTYALSSEKEFVAVAFSDLDFQKVLAKYSDLSGVAKLGKPSTLFERFMNVIRKVFNAIVGTPKASLLEALVRHSDRMFTGPKGGRKLTGPTSEVGKAVAGSLDFDAHMKLAETLRAHRDVAHMMSAALMQHQQVQAAVSKAKAAVDSGKETGSNFLLQALSMRQMAKLYSRFFGTGRENPLSKYMGAFEQRNSYSSELLEEADKLSRRWTALEEKGKEGVELSRLMHDATVNGVHADKPGTDLYARFSALSPEAQQLYKDVREYYKATQVREVQLMLANALRASKLWPGGDIDHESIDLEGITKGQWLERRLGIDIKAEEAKLKADAKTLDKRAYKAREADLENTKEELKLIARMASIPSMQEGPYFPLMRFGDYAVRAERVVKTEVFATRKERSEAMDAWHEKDPTLQFSFPQTDDGTFPLTVKEVEFRLAETRTEAEAAREDLLKLYEGGKVSSVQLKRTLMTDGATIESNRALQTLLGKLDGNAAAQAALREFYIKSLSDRSFRKREAKRKNVRGADPTLQHRTFGAYSKSASYYTAQLRYGHIMADAKAEMRKVVEDHNDERDISAVKLGQIVREIETRDSQAATLTDVPAAVRTMVETGQLWLLLSPSYWMINATQPYMVTIPWLAARSSLPKATAEMAKAQSLILDPLVTQGIESWGGLKALKSRLAAEKAFSVLENVTGSIEKRMREQGQDPQPVLDMLTALKRESIIDLSFVAELRDIAEGEQQGAWNKIMDASRVLAHLTEVNNRITTAIAAFNVAKSNGSTDEQATAFAKDAVAETQFDYSAANKPRLFSANDAWWKPLVFQFMQYVQHMYVLFFRHASMWWNAERGSKEAEIGRRVVLGLLSTHLMAGGMLGATPQIAKWAIGMALALFGAGDDEDRNFKNWASGEYYDRVMSDTVSWMLGDGKASEVVRAGLPRLAGFDLSSRVAFLQTYFIDLDTRTRETLYGSIVSSFGGPMFGIFGNAFDSIELMLEGDADKAAEKLLPKLGRDVVRAWRYANEGMVDHTGKAIIGADQMSPWEIFLTSMGFQPSQVAEVYARNTKVRESEAFVSRRKAEIMAAYRKAGSTGEIDSVMADLREFNQQFPQDRITVSQLLRSVREMRRAELNVQRYGVDAGKRSGQYADDTYNVE